MKIFAACAAVFVACLSSWVHAQTPPPLQAFSRLPSVSDIAISPDGKKLAMLEFENGAASVGVYSIETGARAARLGFGAVKGRNVEWAGDDHVLVTITQARRAQDSMATLYEWARVLSFDIRDGKQRWLTPGADASGNVSHRVWGHLPGDATGVLMPTLTFFASSYNPSTGSRIKNDTPEMDAFKVVLYRVDAASGSSRAFAVGDRFTGDWIIDAKGETRARADLDPGNRTFTIFAPGSVWRRVLDIPDQVRPPLSLIAAGAAPNSVLVIDRRGESPGLKSLDMQTGALTAAAFPGVTGDAIDADIDPLTREIVNVRTTDGLFWIAPKLKQAYEGMTRALPKFAITLTSWSTDRSRVIIAAESPSAPTTFYLFDTTRRTADTVGEDYPELAQATLGEKTQIQYAARDGVMIPAYLTWPPERERKNLPLIVLPHGGPEAADEPGFDWLAQFFATRGYLVLQPQFRGSSGLGRAWADAGRRQWGGVMQNDLSDGVKYLAGAGSADPKRVCIVGISYGGYAALAGATLTPDLYACAASINGVADLPMMIRHERARGQDQGNETSLNYWVDHIGPEGDPAVRAASPVNRAAEARAPILLIHGRSDSVVPFAQTQAMAEALRRHGKKFSVVELAAEDHWLSTAKARDDSLAAVEPFLADALNPR